MTPRLSGWVGAAGAELVQLLTTICGRPPANASVVAILRVRAPIWDDVSVDLMVNAPTALKIAIGKEEIELPTVKVTGPQEDIRESLGLGELWSGSVRGAETRE